MDLGLCRHDTDIAHTTSHQIGKQSHGQPLKHHRPKIANEAHKSIDKPFRAFGGIIITQNSKAATANLILNGLSVDHRRNSLQKPHTTKLAKCWTTQLELFPPLRNQSATDLVFQFQTRIPLYKAASWNKWVGHRFWNFSEFQSNIGIFRSWIILWFNPDRLIFLEFLKALNHCWAGFRRFCAGKRRLVPVTWK